MKDYPVCAISGKRLHNGEGVPIASLRPQIVAMMRADHPELPDEGLVSRQEADQYRSRYLEQLLEQERGALGELERRVLSSLENRETISENIEASAAKAAASGRSRRIRSPRLAAAGSSSSPSCVFWRSGWR